jgi:hypothetical protein
VFFHVRDVPHKIRLEALSVRMTLKPSSRGAKSDCKWHNHLHDGSTAIDRLGLYEFGPISLQRPQSYLGQTVKPNPLIRLLAGRYDHKLLKVRCPKTSDLREAKTESASIFTNLVQDDAPDPIKQWLRNQACCSPDSSQT